MKKILSSILILALSLSLSLMLLTSCGVDGEGSTAFVSVDINPSVELSVKDGVVTGVYGANEDAKVVLYSEEGLEGLTVEEAVEKITDSAIELGYIDSENKVVNTSVSSSDKGYEEKLLKKVDSGISATATKKGLTVTVSHEGAYSLVRRLEALKAQNPDNNAVAELSVGRMRLLMSAEDTGELTIEAALDMTDEELIAIINNHHSAVESFATEAFLIAKKTAEYGYLTALTSAENIVYLKHYLKDLLSIGENAYVAALFTGYKTGASIVNAVADILAVVSNSRNYEMTEEQVASVMTALAIEDRKLIENGEGKVTLRSIETYADRTFKNSEAGKELEEMKKSLSEQITKIEPVLQQKRAEYAKEYADLIDDADEIMEGAEELLNVLLPKEQKELLEKSVKDFEAILDQAELLLSDGSFSVQDLRAIAKSMDDKAAELLGAIMLDFTEEELEAINLEIEKAKEGISSSYKILTEKIDAAEKEAKKYLEALRDERIAAISGNSGK